MAVLTLMMHVEVVWVKGPGQDSRLRVEVKGGLVAKMFIISHNQVQENLVETLTQKKKLSFLEQ